MTRRRDLHTAEQEGWQMTQTIEAREAVTMPVGAETLEALASLAEGASSNRTREVLTGIHFGAGRAEVTDSYIAVVLELGTFDADVIADARTLKDACKRASKALKALGYYSEEAAVLTLAGDAVTLEWPGGTERIPATEGAFPNLAQLWPSASRGDDGVVLVGLNPIVLTKLFKAMGVSKAADAGRNVLKFMFHDALKPIAVSPVDGGNRTEGLIMPVRLS